MFTARIKNVKLFENENGASVQLTVDVKFEGFAIVDGAAIKTDINAISINRSALTAQLCAASDLIACYRATLGVSFNQKQLAVILFGASIDIERELVAAGEIRKEREFDRDCYLTSIVGIKLSSSAEAKLDKACEL